MSAVLRTVTKLRHLFLEKFHSIWKVLDKRDPTPTPPPFNVFSEERWFKILYSDFSQPCVLREAGTTAPRAGILESLNSVPWVLSWLLTDLVWSQLLQNCQSGQGSGDGKICARGFGSDLLRNRQICRWAKCTWGHRN